MIRFLLGLIVILGIVCLYQINKQREGMDITEMARRVGGQVKETAEKKDDGASTSSSASASAGSASGGASSDPPDTITAEGAQALATSIQTQMVAAGVPTPSQEEMSQLFEQLATLVTQEVAAANNYQNAIQEAEDTSPVENTVAPTLPFPDTSFFTGDTFGSAFCPINQGNPTQLQNQCSLLTADSCNATDCCIWVNGTKCVAGDARGPMEMNLDAKYYSHKYQCHGGCPPSPPT